MLLSRIPAASILTTRWSLVSQQYLTPLLQTICSDPGHSSKYSSYSTQGPHSSSVAPAPLPSKGRVLLERDCGHLSVTGTHGPGVSPSHNSQHCPCVRISMYIPSLLLLVSSLSSKMTIVIYNFRIKKAKVQLPFCTKPKLRKQLLSTLPSQQLATRLPITPTTASLDLLFLS